MVGKRPIKQHEYHYAPYQELLSKVVPLRTEFRRQSDTLARREIAKNELDLWNGYLELRKSDVDQQEALRQQHEDDVEFKE